MNLAFENKIKSYFLSSLVLYSVLITGLGIYQITTDSGTFTVWLSVTVAAFQIAFFFGRLHLVNVPRTTHGLGGFSIGIFMATMYSVYTSYTKQVASPAPLLALISLCGWLAYVAWYSELGDRSKEKVKEGKRLPKIPFEDYDGNKLTSLNWKGGKRLVIFYRGNWCPICTAQINELAKFEKDFQELNLKVTLISPQSHQKSKNHANRVGMNYDFLVDVDNSAARILGILHANGIPKGLGVLGYDTDVPKPTTFVLDEEGKVIFADCTTNYRLRTNPQDIVMALRTVQ
jgi:peroxiredoxin